MSKKATTGGIIAGALGLALGVGSYLMGRKTKGDDANDEEAEEYLQNLEAEDTTSDEEDEEDTDD